MGSLFHVHIFLEDMLTIIIFWQFESVQLNEICKKLIHKITLTPLRKSFPC